MFETLINQGRELLGIKPGVSKVAALASSRKEEVSGCSPK